MTFPSRRLRALLALLAQTASSLQGQSTADLDDNRISDLISGLTSFTLAEDLLGATYRVESDVPSLEDGRITTLKWPWGDDFDVGARTAALHVEVVAGVLTARERGTLPAPSGDARFEQDWTAFGLRVGTGWNFRPAAGWILRPGVGAALTRVENEADFDALGESELAPLLDGVVVNWEAWALGFQATLALLNEQRFGDVRSRFASRWAIGTTDVFSSTSAFQEGTSSAQHLALRSQFDGPTGWLWQQESVRWDLFLAYEAYSGVERDALGFDQLYEVGAGLTARPFRRFPKLSLTTSWITGPGIAGWSLGLSLAR